MTCMSQPFRLAALRQRRPVLRRCAHVWLHDCWYCLIAPWYCSLIQLYIDIEITDRHNTFYEKFTTRYQVCWCCRDPQQQRSCRASEGCEQLVRGPHHHRRRTAGVLAPPPAVPVAPLPLHLACRPCCLSHSCPMAAHILPCHPSVPLRSARSCATCGTFRNTAPAGASWRSSSPSCTCRWTGGAAGCLGMVGGWVADVCAGRGLRPSSAASACRHTHSPNHPSNLSLFYLLLLPASLASAPRSCPRTSANAVCSPPPVPALTPLLLLPPLPPSLPAVHPRAAQRQPVPAAGRAGDAAKGGWGGTAAPGVVRSDVILPHQGWCGWCWAVVLHLARGGCAWRW